MGPVSVGSPFQEQNPALCLEWMSMHYLCGLYNALVSLQFSTTEAQAHGAFLWASRLYLCPSGTI